MPIDRLSTDLRFVCKLFHGLCVCVVRTAVDEETMTVTDFVRYEVVDFFSIYMGAIRELDREDAVYLWLVGGNYMRDYDTPPA